MGKAVKWENKGHQLEHMAADWDFEQTYYIWGAAISGTNLYHMYGSRLKVKAFIDSDREKQGQSIDGIAIKSFDETTVSDGEKIIVASYRYQEIARILKEKGCRENVDFCESGVFIALHKWFDEGKVYLKRVDVSVTTRCTLNCKYCNMWTPLYKQPYDKPFSVLKEDIDLLFQWVSCIERFYILGGEVMIYPHLNEFIEYIGENYRNHIIKLQIFTNGTVMPGEQLLKLMKKYDMNMIISDYSDAIPKLSDNIDKIAAKLREHDIEYLIEKYDSWLDFGSPLDEVKKDEYKAADTFDRCRISWKGLEGGRLYFCHSDCSAKRAGLIPEEDSDYFDLHEYQYAKSIELLEFSLGYNQRGYLELCKTCRGESGNDKTIPVAEQVRRREGCMK